MQEGGSLITPSLPLKRCPYIEIKIYTKRKFQTHTYTPQLIAYYLASYVRLDIYPGKALAIY